MSASSDVTNSGANLESAISTARPTWRRRLRGLPVLPIFILVFARNQPTMSQVMPASVDFHTPEPS